MQYFNRTGPPWAPRWSRWLAFVAIVAFLGVTGCTETSSGRVVRTQKDTGTSADAGGDAGVDTGATTENLPSKNVYQGCASGGTTRGGGVTALNCFGPDNASGMEAHGGGITWQPGASRVVIPSSAVTRRKFDVFL